VRLGQRYVYVHTYIYVCVCVHMGRKERTLDQMPCMSSSGGMCVTVPYVLVLMWSMSCTTNDDEEDSKITSAPDK
jgi:hypothetical protein